MDFDLLDLLIDERNHAWEGHAIAAVKTCLLTTHVLKELVSDNDNRIVLKLCHCKARLLLACALSASCSDVHTAI